MTYTEGKEKARQKAIDWQNYMSENRISWSEFAIATGYFQMLGKRYGLLGEFRDNGII